MTVPKQPAKPVPRKETLDRAVQTRQPVIDRKHRQTAEPANVDEKESPFKPLSTDRVRKPSSSDNSTVAVNRDKQPDAFGLAEEEIFTPPNHPVKSKPALNTAEVSTRQASRNEREKNPPIDTPFETHEHGPDAIPPLPRHGLTRTQAVMTQQAVAQQNDATITATSIRQAKEALGLFSADASPPPSPVREKREPQVQIGTIEVIVESTPVAQRSSSQNTGFTRDPGRYYLRRL